MKIKKLSGFMLCVLILLMAIQNNFVFAAEHTHDERCYTGTQHTCSGSATAGGACFSEEIIYHKHVGSEGETSNGCYTYPDTIIETITHNHTDECKTTLNCYHDLDTVTITGTFDTCTQCGKSVAPWYTATLECKNSGTIELNNLECSSCGVLGNCYINPNTNKTYYSHSYEGYNCGLKEGEQYTNTKQIYRLGCGKTEGEIDKIAYTKTCGKENGAYYDDNGNKVNPVCSSIVVSIAAKKPSQNTTSPDFTLIATYLDGHTAEIQPTSTSYVSTEKYYNGTIFLYYEGKIDNAYNIGKKETTMKLTNNSDGDVQAKDVVVSIVAKNPTQYTNTPDFTLIATYLDGHTAEIPATSTSYIPNKTYSNENVVLNYTGHIKDKEQVGTLSTTIVLTTQSKDNVIVSIKPKVPVQHTETPDFTLIATYLDGSVREVFPTSTNYNGEKTYTNEKIELIYHGYVEQVGKIGDLKTSITLTTSGITTSDKVVVNIVPKYSTQVTKNPDFTLIATYLDGSVKEIQPTSTSYEKDVVYSNSLIMVNYYGHICDTKTIGTLSTSVILTTDTTSSEPLVPDNTIESVENENEKGENPTTTIIPTITGTPSGIPVGDEEINYDEYEEENGGSHNTVTIRPPKDDGDKPTEKPIVINPVDRPEETISPLVIIIPIVVIIAGVCIGFGIYLFKNKKR